MKKNSILFFLLAGISILVSNCTKPSASSKGTTFIAPTDTNFAYLGRIDFSNPAALRFAYTGVSIRFRFEGSTCIVHMKNKSFAKDKEGNPFKNYYAVVVDNGKPQYHAVSNEDEKIKIRGLGKGIHEVTVFKRTEAMVGEGIFEGIEIEKEKTLLPVTPRNHRIEFIGNSITCGYGNEGDSKECPFSPETENGYMAYGPITARKLNADYAVVAYSGRGMYRNYDGKTTNTMSLIYDRIFPDSTGSPKWDYTKWQPEVVVVNLGTNDFAKDTPDSMIFVNTYVNFLKRLRNYYPSASIFCLDGPMVSDYYPQGAEHLTKLRNYIKAAQRRIDPEEKNVYTFSLSTQGEGDYGCDWHPNVGRHQKMSDELTKFIKAKMKW